jgi:hypothetical protein
MDRRVLIATVGGGITRAEGSVDGTWEVEPLLPGADVRCLYADPVNREVVYAGTQGKGVLRSDDRGKTWQPVGLDGQIIKALAVSRIQADTLYAGTKPTLVYVSHDRGASWTELEAFRKIPGRWLWLSPAELPFTAYVQGIALSPTNPNVLVVGIEAGAVVRSDDGGKTWSKHRTGALRDCHSIQFHGTDGNRVYEAGGTGAGAAYSQNAGETFAQPREGLDRHYGWACAAHPARPEMWFVSESPMPSGFGPPPAHIDGKANAGIYRKIGEASWERLSGGLPEPLNYMAYALVTDPLAPDHLYAGLSHGEVWHSRDCGDSWRQLPVNMHGVHRTMVLL